MSNKKVSITIDEQKISAVEGEKLLWTALDNHIYIPNLCAIREENRPSAGCRLCFVEVEGISKPVTACTQTVKEGMKVKTRSSAVDRLVKTAFELLLSDHQLDCASCPAKRSCELIKIAKERGLKLKQKRFKNLEREQAIDESTDLFTFDRNKCVLCGRCVWEDRQTAKAGAIGFSNRGLSRVVTTFQDKDLADSPCIECGACVNVCPVGALFFKDGS